MSNFKNPKGNLKYKGSFIVELTGDAYTSIVSAFGILKSGATVIVPEGSIKQKGVYFQFHHKKLPFGWYKKFIISIHNSDGEPLWVNEDFNW